MLAGILGLQAGDTVGALGLIRNEWGLMRQSSRYYSGGVWEYVALDGTPGLGAGTNLSHGWSSTPTADLSKYVLGVRPVISGYKVWLIMPQPGDLARSEGKVPTPYGPIEVAWRRTSPGLHLEIKVPEGTSGVPIASGSGSVTDNGRPTRTAKNGAAVNPTADTGDGKTGYA